MTDCPGNSPLDLPYWGGSKGFLTPYFVYLLNAGVKLGVLVGIFFIEYKTKQNFKKIA